MEENLKFKIITKSFLSYKTYLIMNIFFSQNISLIKSNIHFDFNTAFDFKN